MWILLTPADVDKGGGGKTLIHKTWIICSFLKLFPKWTTIKFGHHAWHFYENFDHLLKINNNMKAFLVPPYGIRSEKTRKNALSYFQKIPIMICKDCPGITLSINVCWKLDKSNVWPPIYDQKLTNLSGIRVLY